MDSFLVVVFGVFVIAGFVKGVIGLGLPTVSIGLLATVITPSQALALVIVPTIITNIWQTFAGPYLPGILRRLWPMLLAVAIGVFSGAGLMTGPYARYGTLTLGVLLVIYAILSLTHVRFSVAPSQEKWVGAIVGLITGVISAATGVQIFPSMPFMQAIGMEKDELVQALGVFFTMATLVLGFNLTAAGIVTAATALPGAVALVAAFAGMYLGQLARARMDADTFRRWFLIAMMLLGLYLAGQTLAKIYGY